MSTLTINLKKPVARGCQRHLTRAECDSIRGHDSDVEFRPNSNWTIHRNEAGELSLRREAKTRTMLFAIQTKDPDMKINWSEFPLGSAIAAAERAANKRQKAQTVYSSESTASWWHTHPTNSVLKGAKLHVTVLPERYFLH